MYDLTRFVERIKKAKIIHFEYISKTRIKTRWMQRNCFSSSPSSPSFPGNNKSYVTRASRIRLTFVCIEHRRGGIFEQKTLERSGWSAERYANVTRSSDDPRDTLERIIGPSDHCFLSRGQNRFHESRLLHLRQLRIVRQIGEGRFEILYYILNHFEILSI